jgi:hypothetical protein
VIVRLGVGDAKPDRDQVEERRVGKLGAPAAEIVPGVEDELEPASARLVRAHERLAGAPVGVGRDIGDKLALACVRSS